MVVICGSRPELIEQCVASLAAQPEAPSLQLILVNNVALTQQASDSIEQLHRSAFRHLEFIHNTTQLGFATNSNRAARCSLPDVEYFLFLNDDTVMPVGVLSEMLGTCSRQPWVGAITPKLVYPGGQPQRCASYFPLGWDGVLLALAGRKRKVDPIARRPFWLRGVCLLVRRSAFEAVGGWDSTYDPGYGEDIELCYRLWRAGWRVAICETATVVHYESQSFHKHSDTWYRLSLCGVLRFVNRHASPVERVALRLAWLTGLLLRLVASLLPVVRFSKRMGKPSAYLAVLSYLLGVNKECK